MKKILIIAVMALSFGAYAQINPVFEKENIIALNKGGKNITLEPGNQIELSGDKLNHMHEACAESQDYLFELKQVTKKLDIKIIPGINVILDCFLFMRSLNFKKYSILKKNWLIA